MNAVIPLRLALLANAIFSLASSMFMVFSPAQVGGWLGVNHPLIFQCIGFGLVVFAAELIFQSTRRRINTWRALVASAADFAWVIGSAVLLLSFPGFFSPSGNLLVSTIAVTVFGLGAWQIWAIGRAHKAGENGQYRHCIIVETDVPSPAMWRVIGDVANIKDYIPSLKSSSVLDSRMPGVGTIRACEDRNGKKWSEEITDFSPGNSFAVRFMSEAPNFPFPVKMMRGGWTVAASTTGSRVMVWWELTPKSVLFAPILLPILAFQADRDFPKIIQRMAEHAMAKYGEVQIQAGANIMSRLLPTMC